MSFRLPGVPNHKREVEVTGTLGEEASEKGKPEAGAEKSSRVSRPQPCADRATLAHPWQHGACSSGLGQFKWGCCQLEMTVLPNILTIPAKENLSPHTWYLWPSWCGTCFPLRPWATLRWSSTSPFTEDFHKHAGSDPTTLRCQVRKLGVQD